MVDRLESLLERFSVSARMFHAGTLCGINDLAAEDGTGQLHFIRRGVVEVSHGGDIAVRVDTPSLLLYPRPLAHRFITDPASGADLTCAHVRFDGGAANPIAATHHSRRRRSSMRCSSSGAFVSSMSLIMAAAGPSAASDRHPVPEAPPGADQAGHRWAATRS